MAHIEAAHGSHTDHGVPHGSTSLTPFITVADARGAIEFYAEVFGARVLDVTEMGGSVVHAELQLDSGRLQLGEPSRRSTSFRRPRVRTTATRSACTAPTSTPSSSAPSGPAPRSGRR